MYTILIALSTLFALSSGQARSPSSHYLLPQEVTTQVNFTDCYNSTNGESIFNFTIANLNTSLPNITFSEYRGKVILVVNVATFCRSNIEYPDMNKLADQFGSRLVIVAVPSDQFWNQEPTGNPVEIFNAIKYVRPGNGFVPKFHLTQRVAVNGPNESPIFSFLKRSCVSTKNRFEDEVYLLYEPKNDRDLKWNFEKFLIHPTTGLPIRRYDTSYNSSNIAGDIQSLIESAHVQLN